MDKQIEEPLDTDSASLESSSPPRSKKKLGRKKARKKTALTQKERRRVSRNFPASSFEEALDFAKAIFRVGSGKARLVIVDLSHHNPNVFYELAIRHMMRLPVVQIIRTADKIPFDINQMRTIVIDDTDIYSLVPKIESYRSEIATQIRRALDDPDSVDNPITTHYPALKAIRDNEARTKARKRWLNENPGFSLITNQQFNSVSFLERRGIVKPATRSM
ncbi:hypothetical protein ACVIIV_000103 [Bradyrhizobium sp. USDA 4354]